MGPLRLFEREGYECVDEVVRSSKRYLCHSQELHKRAVFLLLYWHRMALTSLLQWMELPCLSGLHNTLIWIKLTHIQKPLESPLDRSLSGVGVNSWCVLAQIALGRARYTVSKQLTCQGKQKWHNTHPTPTPKICSPTATSCWSWLLGLCVSYTMIINWKKDFVYRVTTLHVRIQLKMKWDSILVF